MKRENLRWTIFISVLAFFQFFYIYIFFIEPNWLKIEHVIIVNTKLSNALSGVKVIQLSDLEIQRLGYREVVLIEKINKLKPDLILITGDLVGDPDTIHILWNVLKLLEPKFHTYVVTGDADSAIFDFRYAKQWDKANTYVLDGKAIRLNLRGKDDTYFWLIGTGNKDLRELVQNVSKDEPSILLNHWPDIVKAAATKKIDLVLAGHTHGGQVGIPLFWRFFPYAKRSAYVSGLYKVKDTLLYVNRGITAEKNIRFLCWPEITVFEFVSKGKMHYRVLPQDK
ncbi:MAG: metallophosphoesterase [Candidatus Omnitrophica bacterium]|nr:metallophosphoesterase [Candidatus Omnitrophota bacterium]